MKIEDLKLKVQAAEQKVEKCKATILRHRAQLDKRILKAKELGCIILQDESQYKNYWSFYDSSTFTQEQTWAIFDIKTKLDDMKGAFQKLNDAERICANWKEKLDFEINKEKIIEDTAPQVIKDFLEDWKQKSFEWYKLRHASFLDFKAELREEEREAKTEALRTLSEYADLRERFGDELYTDFHINNPWPRKPMEDFLKERDLDYKSIKSRLSAYADQTIMKMCEFRDEDARLKWLDGALEQEKKAKLYLLITQINDITGPITDASYLCVNAGEINGVIIGEKGAAKVLTFSAGGHSVQCYHFRTRVDDVSNKFKDSPTLDDVMSICRDISANSNLRATKERSADKER